jgi:hypothetical protein
LLLGDNVWPLDESEIDGLLRGGVLMDASAAEALCARGYGSRIGVSVGPAIEIDDLGYETFDDPAFNPLFHGRKHPLRAFAAAGDWRRLETCAGSGIVASAVCNYKQATVAPSVLLTENDRGERFGVLAWNGGGERHIIENRMRAEQLREVFTWIARSPITCATSTPYVWPILNRDPDGRCVVGLINLSTDTYPTVALVWGDERAPEQALVVGETGELEPCGFRVTGQSRGTTDLDVDLTLRPLDIAVLVF